MDSNSPLNNNEKNMNDETENDSVENVVEEQQEVTEEKQEEVSEEVTEEQQEEVKEEVKEEVTEEQQEEVTEEKQEEVTEENQEEVTEENQEEVTEEQQEEVTEEQQEEVTEEKQEEVSEEQQEEVTEEQQEVVEVQEEFVEKIQEKLSEIVSVDDEDIGVITIPDDEDDRQSLKAEHLNIINLGLSVLNRRYGDSINYDNNLLLQITKESIEYIETFNRFTGNEKHIICKEIIKTFLENRNVEWSKIDKVVNNTITFVVSISKNGIQALKLDKKVVGDVQDIFNQLYPLILKDIEKKYPSTDDVVNHLFDICLVTMGYIENYKQINQKQKMILIKNILMKVIELLPTIHKEITNEELKFLEENIDTTLLMVELGFDAQNGNVNVNAEQVEKISNCLFKCLLSCFKKIKK
jgi:chemotaxis protein histidine kinase CheA